MIATNAMLVVSGLVCIILSGFAMRHLMPREGRPDSAWTSTEARAASVVLLLMTLFITGAGLILKGVLT